MNPEPGERTLSAPSDILIPLRRLFQSQPPLVALWNVLSVRMVVDANSILRDLFWLHKTRKNPTARSSLKEAIDAGVIVAYAPPALEKEVKSHFPEFRERFGISAHALEESWAEYRTSIIWVRPREVHNAALGQGRDPTDAPYAALALQIGAAGVYTKDKDFDSFGVTSYTETVTIALRSYARYTATDLTIKVAGAGSIVLTAHGVLALASAVRGCWAAIRRQPDVVQALCAAALVAALLHKPSRDWVMAVTRLLGAAAVEAVGTALVLADSSLTAAKQGLADTPVDGYRNRRPRALVDFLVVSAAESECALTPAELEVKVRKAGYISRSKNLPAYIRRTLTKDERFIRLDRGRWTLAPPPLFGWDS